MLDRLPAWARHAILVLVAAASVPITGAIVAANGALAVDWGKVAGQALDAAGVAAALMLALWATPLTNQYGRGKPEGTQLPEPTDTDPADPYYPDPDPDTDLDLAAPEGVDTADPEGRP